MVNRAFVGTVAALIVALSVFLVWHQTTRPPSLPTESVGGVTTEDDAQAFDTDDTDDAGDDGMMLLPDGEPLTAERVREVCEREIRLRSDLPFTEFPRPGTPEYSEPLWVIDLEAWVWVVELVYEEGMALRREWECRVTGDGRGLLRRNF